MKIWISITLMLITTACPSSEIEQVQPMVGKTVGAEQDKSGGPTVVPSIRRGNVPIEEVPANLFLQAVAGDGSQQVIELQYQRQADGEGPRAVELFVQYPQEWTYEKVDALPAVAEANKRLIVQEKEQGLLRVIIFASTNLDRIDTGGLAAFHFDTKNQAGEVSIRDQMPVFAPVETNEGLVLGEMLRVTP